ncbi:MAG: PAS-domain containing protein, partial [Deltaproteobacteria bacterium]|nr:PAS-domain containing protein [Deltaproteobacteria bacterium]
MLEHELESSPSGICVVDGGGRIVIWNQLFLDLWGLRAEEVKNRPFEAWVQQIQDKLEAQTVFKSFSKTTQDEQEFKEFVEIGLKDGRVLKLDIFPLLREGEYFGRIYYFTDVTEGKRGEKVMTEYASELQRIVASRTQELIEAERLAASGSLAREIAHDLR